MNLLEKGIELNEVIPTEHLKKLTIDGHTQDYKVYKIKLDTLYYNDQNDRIATWINQYKIENNVDEIDNSNKNDYNSIIHNFITKSNTEALKKTKKNIQMVGQTEAGVVLLDGRIIDGNRRFTCLRDIQKEDNETRYFEAVILDRDIENSKKQIKMLELQLQHGIDEKVGYSPIDRLVGIYNDIVETELLTIKEYAKSVGQPEIEIELDVERGKLMVEFLEFFNMGKKFHFAREFNLLDPLKELQKILKKYTDEDRKEDLKHIIFTQFFNYDGDKTRYTRKIAKIVNNPKYIENYIEEHSELIYELQEKVAEYEEGKVAQKEIAILKSDQKVKENLEKITEKFSIKIDSDSTKNKPSKDIEKAWNFLDSIDNNILKKLTAEQKNEINEKLDRIEGLIVEIKSGLNV